MLLETRTDQLIIMDSNGNIDTKPKTDYFLLKYKDFDGDRINYQFDKDSYIQETFNDGIFNCTFQKESMQIREADKIAFCINFHRLQIKAKDEIRTKPFADLFKKNYVETIQLDVLKDFLKDYKHRLEFLNDGIEVDQRFFVNKVGQASVKKKGVYHNLCIVAEGYLGSFNYESKIGKIEINSKSLEIIAKVFFLLNPNLKDGVFINQLEPETIEEIKRDLNDMDLARKTKDRAGKQYGH